MRILIAALVLLGGCATQPAPELPQPGRYAELDRLMENALDGYADGQMLTAHQMGLVLDNLVVGVDKSRLATVPGLRVAMLDKLAARCDEALRLDPEGGAHSEECYASRKAHLFFDVVTLVARDIGWRLDETYTIAEYESRARRALALYPWTLNP